MPELPDQVDGEVPDVAAGDVVELAARRSGLGIVRVVFRGRKLYTPSPTAAAIVDGPIPLPNGLCGYLVKLLDGPYRGRTVSCHPNVIHRP